MPFDCSFDAPMFVDFQNLDGDHQDQQQAEAYFEVDHETDINNQPNPPKSADSSKITEVIFFGVEIPLLVLGRVRYIFFVSTKVSFKISQG